ncbi:MAG: hypothetical protein ACI9JN_000796 [Bacteroidia bacterium]|jgi:hypothetical protein
MKTCLILGRKGNIVQEISEQIDTTNLKVLMGTSKEEVQDAFLSNTIDTVIMGAGIDLDTRLDIIRYVFEHSNSTTVHMKDWDSGPAGMLPFVTHILSTY